ncbi:MAG: methylaspartate mutase [Streptosporangiaceae bacterium]
MTSSGSAPRAGGDFADYISRSQAAGRLVVQPRMGMADPAEMRAGLLAVRDARAATVGTITLDSYTRVNDHDRARHVLAAGGRLNGYPIVAHSRPDTARMLAGVASDEFAIQVRHGSACPRQIFTAMIQAGLHATEGGPISYCLPYSREPVAAAVEHWTACCELLTKTAQHGGNPHLETFGGCMLGQLCPPGMLIAISILEGLFFRSHGLRSVSLSYAQQTNPAQDLEALAVLRQIVGELLHDVDWHIVVYAYMGLYPRTSGGARRLLAEAAELAVRGGAARLIVKTTAEAHRLPTIAENVAALEFAAAAAERHRGLRTGGDAPETGIYSEARALIDAVLELDDDIGRAMVLAVQRGYLDIPYCLHPDNAGRARAGIDPEGRLQWTAVGSLPLSCPPASALANQSGSADLLAAIGFVARKFDAAAAGAPDVRTLH